ncbi:hypothetical protein AAFF_G00170790 [Aldrovandia affinis]|uniref:Uncharacterized protein n=1 Tax=Aldrovandia affinis TaxID=143900 RepID=A0AAD7RLH9_9TELE|nr:hypothetical protein AAFF_G00170790 [Aldrovandia affinis]
MKPDSHLLLFSQADRSACGSHDPVVRERCRFFPFMTCDIRRVHPATNLTQRCAVIGWPGRLALSPRRSAASQPPAHPPGQQPITLRPPPRHLLHAAHSVPMTTAFWTPPLADKHS